MGKGLMNHVPPPPGGVIDLSTLKNKHHENPDTPNEHLAGILQIACSLPPEHFTNIDGTPEQHEAFVQGYVTSLHQFIDLTTGGLVNIDQSVYQQLANVAWMDHLGMLAVYQLANIERKGTPTLIEAYNAARKVSEHHTAGLAHLRDQIAAAMNTAADMERAKTAVMMHPNAFQGGMP